MGINIQPFEEGVKIGKAYRKGTVLAVGEKTVLMKRPIGYALYGSSGKEIYIAGAADRHGEAFRRFEEREKPETLGTQLNSLFGDSQVAIEDPRTGTVLVIDSENDITTMIDPEGGLTEPERRQIKKEIDITGDIPSHIIEKPAEYKTDSELSSGFGNLFAPSISVEGGTGGGEGGGTIGKGMLLVVGAVIVVLVMLFGRGK